MDHIPTRESPRPRGFNHLANDASWHATCVLLSIPTRQGCPMSLENVEKLIRDHKVEFVDLRFADM
ncbi:MAG TPA: hypothetical protein VK827_04930, partial [Lysobacter sp.]|nr:hypothetical protein [Lysobacter sp.]